MQLDVEPAPSFVGLTVRVVRRGRRQVVVVRGEIDRATVPRFAAAIEQALALGSPIEVDLAGVTFMDTSGLRVLHGAHLRLGQLPDAIVLVAPGRAVQRALRLVGIQDLFTVHPAATVPGRLGAGRAG